MEFPKKAHSSVHGPVNHGPWPTNQDAGRHGWGATFVPAAPLYNSPFVKKFDRSHPVSIVWHDKEKQTKGVILRAQS
jgi:hypothetical protein